MGAFVWVYYDQQAHLDEVAALRRGICMVKFRYGVVQPMISSNKDYPCAVCGHVFGKEVKDCLLLSEDKGV